MRPDLAACYGQERLPRYTSYPTAPHFSSGIGPDTYAEWLKALPPHATASLYLHVPFCRSMCWYCGCHTSVARRDEPIAVYASALRCEIDLVSQQIDRRIKVDHIHFGGGTPTIMAPELFADLIGSIRHCFFVLSVGRNRHRDRSAHAHASDDRRARLWRRQPGEPWRAELRSRGSARHQPGAEFRGDRGRDRRPAAGRHHRHQFRPDLRAAAPDRRVVSRHRSPLRRASSRSIVGVRLRACAGLQEAPAQDRRGVAARQPRAP